MLVARWQVPVVEVVIQGDLDAGSVEEAERVIGEGGAAAAASAGR
ncbi:hypothetical protein [Catellatospora sp. IY07-71]|nr:hypothetical protein [Catellatospora sp. IY07-71]